MSRKKPINIRKHKTHSRASMETPKELIYAKHNLSDAEMALLDLRFEYLRNKKGDHAFPQVLSQNPEARALLDKAEPKVIEKSQKLNSKPTALKLCSKIEGAANLHNSAINFNKNNNLNLNFNFLNLCMKQKQKATKKVFTCNKSSNSVTSTLDAIAAKVKNLASKKVKHTAQPAEKLITEYTTSVTINSRGYFVKVNRPVRATICTLKSFIIKEISLGKSDASILAQIAVNPELRQGYSHTSLNEKVRQVRKTHEIAKVSKVKTYKR